jgi:hypothetical protein
MAYFNLENYEPVENRIRAFWLKYPDGRLLTDLKRSERSDGRIEWICRSEAYLNAEDPRPSATGFATEIEGTSPVNRANASENCETSSIGRCLANLGFAAKGRRPSREEMGKAMRGVARKELKSGDYESLLKQLITCTNQDQLSAWSAYAATFNLPEGKRSELLRAFNDKRVHLSKSSEVA